MRPWPASVRLVVRGWRGGEGVGGEAGGQGVGGETEGADVG